MPRATSPEAHYYMAELHIMNGNLPLAVRQLELAARDAPASKSVQRARFEARIAEVRAAPAGQA